MADLNKGNANNHNNMDDLKNQILNPPDLTSNFSPEDIDANKGVAIAATFPILFWIPVALKGDSSYGKFYANQGLTLLIMSVVLNIFNAIVGVILSIIPAVGGFLAGIIGLACSLIMLAAWLFLFVNALNGKAKEIPLVGGLLKAFN